MRLLDLGKTQNWLIEELKKKTGMFVDNSLLNKILTGRAKSKALEAAIDEIIASKG